MTPHERLKITLASANLYAIVQRETIYARTGLKGSEFTVKWAAEALASLDKLLTEAKCEPSTK